jgi:hypothetical protein
MTVLYMKSWDNMYKRVQRGVRSEILESRKNKMNYNQSFRLYSLHAFK